MRDNLQTALENTETVYSQLVVIANGIVKEYTKDIDKIITDSYNGINELNNDMLRHLIITLSLKSYNFSEVKEKSLLKSQCAEALRKEAYAVEYNKAEGPVATRENTATINISDEVLTENIYDLVSSLLKTKQDEIHRVVDALKTVLMSRMAEAKLAQQLDE